MKISKAIFGEKLFGLIMKATFYGHFVAGEDQKKIVPTLERLFTDNLILCRLQCICFYLFTHPTGVLLCS